MWHMLELISQFYYIVFEISSLYGLIFLYFEKGLNLFSSAFWGAFQNVL